MNTYGNYSYFACYRLSLAKKNSLTFIFNILKEIKEGSMESIGHIKLVKPKFFGADIRFLQCKAERNGEVIHTERHAHSQIGSEQASCFHQCFTLHNIHIIRQLQKYIAVWHYFNMVKTIPGLHGVYTAKGGDLVLCIAHSPCISR